MSKDYVNKYWEKEEPETCEFENKFFRVYEKAGKLQIGKIIKDKDTGEKKHIPKIVVGREKLLKNEDAIEFLFKTLENWQENY